MYTAAELRKLLKNDQARCVRIGLASNDELAELVSRMILDFPFDSWRYDCLSEVIDRLTPSETRSVTA